MRHALIVCIAFLAFVCVPSVHAGDGAVLLHVAPGGSDEADGSADRPLASLTGARDLLRKLRERGGVGAATVEVSGGVYTLTQVLELKKEDGGTREAPVVYRAAPGQTVTLRAAYSLTDARVDEGAVLRFDLRAAGIDKPGFKQLYFEGRRQPCARHPNADAANPVGGGWAYVEGAPVAMYKAVPGENGHSVAVKPGDWHVWARPQEGEVFIFPRYNWWNNIVAIKSVDPEKRVLTLASDASYAVRPGDRYFVQGLREELDAPGEWYLDRDQATLYFWPPRGAKVGPESPVLVPAAKNAILVNSASHVTIRGFVVEGSAGDAIVLDRAESCAVVGNTVRCVGDYNGGGIDVRGGTFNSLVGNDVSHVGRNAITVTGGDRATLEETHAVVDNNYLHHFGELYKQGVGVSMTGVGISVTHNLIHDGPRFGILAMANNSLIEFNHLHHLNLETEDTGLIYTGGRDWITAYGLTIRHNLLRDSIGFAKDAKNNWHFGAFAWGVYLDDNTGGVDIVGNIIARNPRGGIHLHNGRDNVISGNLFFDNGSWQYEANGWNAKAAMWVKHRPQMDKGYALVKGQEAWRKMPRFNPDRAPADWPRADGFTMTGNVIEKNVFVFLGEKTMLGVLRQAPEDAFVIDHNLVWHRGLPVESLVNASQKKTGAGWESWQKSGFDAHSLIADPGFVAPEGKSPRSDFRLVDDSPAFKIGFTRIPVEQIGNYASESRASWPIVEEPGAEKWLPEALKKK